MTTKEIYNLAVDIGMKYDLRGKEKVKKYLERAKNRYEKLGKESKKEFDSEKLTNPYSDTRILVDFNKKEINKILVGIDIGGSELLIADKMRDVDL
ncbi:MAG: NGG1p interacting factor NIF3, partial [Candidatus Falkowbacteria bacterium]